MDDHNRISKLRLIGIAEGISFLVLLVIAMPLKYLFGYPEVVRLVGWAHGLLFILYILCVLMAIRPMRWKIIGTLTALAASLIPFGTFVLDKSLKRRQRELESESKS